MSGLNLCANCQHKTVDADGPEWDSCARPNYPAGNWNMLIHVQRYGGFDEACNGRYWVYKGAHDSAQKMGF